MVVQKNPILKMFLLSFDFFEIIILYYSYELLHFLNSIASFSLIVETYLSQSL